MKRGITYKPQAKLTDRILQHLILTLAESLHKVRHASEPVVCWPCQKDAIDELERIERLDK